MLVTLAVQDLLKKEFKMQPTSAQALQATLLIPWSAKFVFGFFSDNIPICGSRRKSYLIISSICMSLSMLLMGIIGVQDKVTAIWLLVFFSSSFAFADIIREALMVS